MSSKLTYVVIENATDVCEGIQRRMMPFTKWQSLGYCTGVNNAIEKIITQKPVLIFLDWGLNGGSAYEVLQAVQNIATYNPYIIFNTGFQRDNPEIPQEILNNYSVDKYLVKPYWETLRNHLSQYLAEAERKSQMQKHDKRTWIANSSGASVQIDLSQLSCIVQHSSDARTRDFYFADADKPVSISLQWSKCIELLKEQGIDFFVTKNRSHLVTKGFVFKYEKPFAWVKGVAAFKLDVVKESLREFEEWLIRK
jgi:two-component system, LytTR family, response regulator